MDGDWARNTQDFDQQLAWAIAESLRETKSKEEKDKERNSKIEQQVAEVVSFTSNREQLQAILKKLPGVKYDDPMFEEFYK